MLCHMAWSAETYSVPLVSATSYKHPYMTVLIQLDSRVIVRVKDSVLALVENQARFLKHSGIVVIAADHTLEIKLSVLRSSAIDKECLVDLLCIDRHRDMLHRI